MCRYGKMSPKQWGKTFLNYGSFSIEFKKEYTYIYLKKNTHISIHTHSRKYLAIMWVWMLHSWPLLCRVPFSEMGVGGIDLLTSSKWKKKVVRKWSFYDHLDILTSVYGWLCQQKFYYLHIGAFYTIRSYF